MFPGGGGGTPLYELYGDVPLDRVWFLVGGDRGVRTSRLPPFFAFLPSPSKLEGFKTRISHKAVPGRTIRRPFIIQFFTTYILNNVNIIDSFCTLS